MDELLNRQVPQSLEAEQSVLGSMLIDERCVPDVIGTLRPEDFYLKQNREIYETIYTLSLIHISHRQETAYCRPPRRNRWSYPPRRRRAYRATACRRRCGWPQ